MDYPRITLVTASFNQGDFIEATIQSVLSQNYPNLEYIIMDGGSTDQTVEIIRRYEQHLAYWQSAPDKGQSDALIKGFARATGVLMNWVNSDDLLAPGALEHVARLYMENPGTGIVAGSTEHFHDNPADFFKKFDSMGWTPEGFLRCTPVGTFAFNQPGAFFARDLYERVGGLNQELHMCMDYDLFLKMCEQNPRILYTTTTTAYFRHHAGSKTTCGTVRNTIREHGELLGIYRECRRRTGVVPNDRYSSNLLHRLLLRCLFHRDFANLRLALRYLRKTSNIGLLSVFGECVRIMKGKSA